MTCFLPAFSLLFECHLTNVANDFKLEFHNVFYSPSPSINYYLIPSILFTVFPMNAGSQEGCGPPCSLHTQDSDFSVNE